MNLGKNTFLALLAGVAVILLVSLMYRFNLSSSFFNRNEVAQNKLNKSGYKFTKGTYYNEEHGILLTIPEELKLIESVDNKNFVSLYTSDQDIKKEINNPVIFISFYQYTFDEGQESNFMIYGETASTENISHDEYNGVHIWGITQEGPGYGQESGVYILNKEGEALSIRYLDQNYKGHAINILNSLEID